MLEETNWIIIIISTVIALEEIIARIVPGKFNGIIGAVIDLLKTISDYLNRDKS